jgi:hypothetical protein
MSKIDEGGDHGSAKMLARVVIVVGALFVLSSLFADPLGFGRTKIFGVVVGALVILGGVYLWMPEGDEPPS